jgi:hypothetical protein
MNSNNDLFGDDPAIAAAMAEMDQHGRAIYELVSDYMDEHEVTEAMACQLMVGIALNMRMLAYGVEVDNPSSGGLKLDLDRFRQEFEDIVRDAKNGADGFIETIKSALATDDEDEGREQ